MYSESRNRSFSPESRGRDRGGYGGDRGAGGRYGGDRGGGYGGRDSYRSSRPRRDRSPPKPSRVLGVFGLSYSTTEDQLREIFTDFGKIERLVIVTDKMTNNSRGFGFISFETVEIAQNAKDKINGMEIDGRTVRVDFSISDKPRDNDGPRDGDRPSYRSERRYDDNGPRGGDRGGDRGDGGYRGRREERDEY